MSRWVGIAEYLWQQQGAIAQSSDGDHEQHDHHEHGAPDALLLALSLRQAVVQLTAFLPVQMQEERLKERA